MNEQDFYNGMVQTLEDAFREHHKRLKRILKYMKGSNSKTEAAWAMRYFDLPDYVQQMLSEYMLFSFPEGLEEDERKQVEEEISQRAIRFFE